MFTLLKTLYITLFTSSISLFVNSVNINDCQYITNFNTNNQEETYPHITRNNNFNTNNVKHIDSPRVNQYSQMNNMNNMNNMNMPSNNMNMPSNNMDNQPTGLNMNNASAFDLNEEDESIEQYDDIQPKKSYEEIMNEKYELLYKIF